MDLGYIQEEDTPLYELASWDMPGHTARRRKGKEGLAPRTVRLNASTTSTRKKISGRA